MKNNWDKLKYALLFFLLVAADQLTKIYAVRYASEEVFRNYNFAFSLVLPTELIYLIYLVLIIGLIYWFRTKADKTKLEYLAVTFILAGAFSNIAERIAQGYVIDFIHLHNAVLNGADFFILIGVGILIFI